MNLLKRTTPLAVVFSVALMGCGGNDPAGGKNNNAPPRNTPAKAFAGVMPTSGSAELTLGIPMS